MSRPIDPSIDDGRGGEVAPGDLDPERFRDALSRWASGVALVAVRDEGRVYATTATAFASVSVQPPLVLVSLGAGAQVLPFLEADRPFGVSLLAEDQRRVASVFADAFPVGASPFPDAGVPLLPASLAGLACRVDALHEAGDHRLVVARVDDVVLDGAGDALPLVHWRRGYRSLTPP